MMVAERSQRYERPNPEINRSSPSFNLHFDTPTQFFVLKVLGIIEIFNLAHAVSKPTRTQGQIVDWVVYRVGDCLFTSLTVDHVFSSDHFCVLRTLDLAKPITLHAYKDVRSLASLDMEVFKTTYALTFCLNPPLPSCSHSPQLAGQLCPTNSSPCLQLCPFSLVYHSGSDLLEAKHKRRRAEQKWQITRLTVHCHIFYSSQLFSFSIVQCFLKPLDTT